MTFTKATVVTFYHQRRWLLHIIDLKCVMFGSKKVADKTKSVLVRLQETFRSFLGGFVSSL